MILKTVCLYSFCAVYSFTHHAFRHTLAYRVALSDHLSEKYTFSHLYRGEMAHRHILSILPLDLQPSPSQLLYIQSSPTISPVSLPPYQLVPLYTS